MLWGSGEPPREPRAGGGVTGSRGTAPVRDTRLAETAFLRLTTDLQRASFPRFASSS